MAMWHHRKQAAGRQRRDAQRVTPASIAASLLHMAYRRLSAAINNNINIMANVSRNVTAANNISALISHHRNVTRNMAYQSANSQRMRIA